MEHAASLPWQSTAALHLHYIKCVPHKHGCTPRTGNMVHICISPLGSYKIFNADCPISLSAAQHEHRAQPLAQ